MTKKDATAKKPRYNKPTVSKNQRELFIIEALASSVERMLLHALIDDPNDETSRAAYADLLEEQGRRESALMVRAGEIPGVQVFDVGVIASGAVTSGALASGYRYRTTVGPGAY